MGRGECSQAISTSKPVKQPNVMWLDSNHCFNLLISHPFLRKWYISSKMLKIWQSTVQNTFLIKRKELELPQISQSRISEITQWCRKVRMLVRKEDKKSICEESTIGQSWSPLGNTVTPSTIRNYLNEGHVKAQTPDEKSQYPWSKQKCGWN